MLADILKRIDQRLARLGLSETAASKAAGRGGTLIKDMRRGTKGDKQVSTAKVDTLLALAPVLETNFLWLATGEGDPDADHVTPMRRALPVLGKVGAGSAVEMPDDPGGAQALDHIEIDIDGDFIAEVVGDSMWPRWLDGERVIVAGQPTSPERLIDSYAVVQLHDDGRRLLKILRRGSRPGTYKLESHNIPAIDDVRLLAAWRVKGTWYG